ncbi:MAG: DegT/DnrJ/EryC1/StrS family aminotransferase, partial [Eubacterium sp.]|nr:DegT/DnrJ/EryC1/StrS family aminotransferase [Eubacterium sp.]
MHGEEQYYINEAFDTNWVTTAGSNIFAIEEQLAEYIGCTHTVALASGTSALHLATKLAGEALYGQAKPDAGTLAGHKVFCSDVTFDASVNP